MKKISIIAIIILIVSAALVGCKKQTADIYEKGVLTDTSFESKYLGIKFSLPAGYVMETQENLYEMMAVEPSGRSSVIVCVENPILSGLTIEQYLNTLKDGLLAQDALEYKLVNDMTSVKIMEEDYEQMTFVLPSAGCYQKYSVRKYNGRLIYIIVTYYTEDQLDTLMNGFSAY
ncbi:MAG: hypothetical protein FWB73_05980 [Treponema sp.]|nr:hypothetical protein [Treponema sp.]